MSEHVLSRLSHDWDGTRGHVCAELIHRIGLDYSSIAILCGPPAMIRRATLPAMRD